MARVNAIVTTRAMLVANICASEEESRGCIAVRTTRAFTVTYPPIIAGEVVISFGKPGKCFIARIEGDRSTKSTWGDSKPNS